MRTDSTVPACWKSSRRSSSVAWKERLPTKSFAGIAEPPAAIRTEYTPPRARQRRQGKPSARGPRQASPQRGRYPTDGPTTCQANLAAECSLFHYVMPLLGVCRERNKNCSETTPRVRKHDVGNVLRQSRCDRMKISDYVLLRSAPRPALQLLLAAPSGCPSAPSSRTGRDAGDQHLRLDSDHHARALRGERLRDRAAAALAAARDQCRLDQLRGFWRARRSSNVSAGKLSAQSRPSESRP